MERKIMNFTKYANIKELIYIFFLFLVNENYVVLLSFFFSLTENHLVKG